jgi:hypothetical protein
VSFPIVDDAEGTKLLAWTTTPWTLPSNLALCVHAQMHYVKIKKTSTGEIWIMAEARLGQLFPPCATFLAAKNRAEEEAAAAAAKAAGKTVEKKEEKADEGGYKSVVARTFNIIFTDEVIAGLEGLDFSILSRCRGRYVLCGTSLWHFCFVPLCVCCVCAFDFDSIFVGGTILKASHNLNDGLTILFPFLFHFFFAATSST